ncbi:MAG TPA: LLM class flavin-dependent oxidoreductase [Microbacteriaceae bacterium]|nr:LLM class flavin-dependent oxidoreductase [Microbacteriaceae bacterium]
MALEFGIFDSIDLGRSTSGEILEGRLRIAALAEECGFDRYHVTEHHGTTLSVSPSPSLFLAALSQRTTRMRIGTLVYVVPAYEPLRLAEEVAVLDQLTGGRFDFGVGRGVSPFELEYFGVAAEASGAILRENLAAILESYRTGVFSHPGGERPTTRLSVLPVQQPHPPLWVASGSLETAARAGAEGTNFVGRWEGGGLSPLVEAYWAARGGAEGSEVEPRVGCAAHLYIGATDAAAEDRYLQAATVYWERLISLWHEHDVYGADFLYDPRDMLDKSNAIVGSADTVRDQLAALLEQSDINYFELTMTYGDLTVDEASDNVRALAGIMPDLRAAADRRVRVAR